MYVIGDFKIYGTTYGNIYINGDFDNEDKRSNYHTFYKDIYVNGIVNAMFTSK